MYTPERFLGTDPETIYSVLSNHAFATVITVEEGVPNANHIPLLIEGEHAQWRLFGHVAKANPLWQSFVACDELLVIFHGPHGYVSPSNYEVPLVPTWNYATVHMYGKASVLDDKQGMRRVVDSLTNKYEGARSEPWIPKYPDHALDKIVCFEINVSRVEAKFKLSQDKSPEDRKAVIADLAGSPQCGDKELSELMARYPYDE